MTILVFELLFIEKSVTPPLMCYMNIAVNIWDLCWVWTVFQNNMYGGGNKHFGSCYIKNNHKNKKKDEFKFYLEKFACSFTKIGTQTIVKGTSLQLLKVCIKKKIPH